MNHRSARWWGVLALFAVAAISYVDRINIAVLVTDSRFLQHFGLGVEDRVSQGWLATAFMLGYGFSSLLLTPLCAARLGVRRGLLCGLALWGVINGAAPMFSSYDMLLISRVLLGIAEGPLFPLASAYIKTHFDAAENGKPNALVNMGTGVGLAIGYPLVGNLVAGLHWEGSFYAIGLLNAVLGIPLVLAFVRTRPGTGAATSMLPAGARPDGMARGALRTKHLACLTLLTSAMLAYLWGSGNWLPAYLKEARGFSLKEMGWFASLPQYALVLGMLVGGLLLDRLRRDRHPVVFIVASACVAAFTLIAITTTAPYLAIFGLIAANLCCGVFLPAIPGTAQRFARQEHIAGAFGIINGVGSLVASLMPTLMGGVIGVVSASSGRTAGFFAGFSLLIGAQCVVLVCGVRLWIGERELQAARSRVDRVPG
ncbi:MFS transporter [Burkholderia ambifaria]|uniref:Major facilitator superfamily MFS_1 n=1 Tax=Burkholderia ambifaria MEX-5 TaxID=396597 RepID=B1T402_9BURK|nr:MFS transporter [Burkholderia ambifaria]EDT41709.1 major facilitator superfamily MFS_1 [Burkholderia ambifaria MEX-5]